jgi:predicted dehydrogenase
MPDKVKVLVVGLGHMGASHASAYHRNPGFEIVGLMSRSIKSTPISSELAGYPLFEDYDAALAATKPDAVSINSWPNTHAEFSIKAIEVGAHVFLEKPLATTIEDAEAVVKLAREKNRKLVLGYILRVHPSWIKFIELGRTLGKPLVMRLNLNQQSNGLAWTWHKNLIDSLTPLVDCGVHYVDVMCQLTGAKPVRVHGIGAKLWDDAAKQNYGHLHVEFDDGSVGWYEAGWGPMMSEVAYFVKDVVGPNGAVSIVAGQTESGKDTSEQVTDSADIDRHTKTEAIRYHHAEVGPDKNFLKRDETFSMADEPGHQELCDREQAFLLKAIQEDLDLTEQMNAAVNSLRIVLAAEQSIEEKRVVELA